MFIVLKTINRRSLCALQTTETSNNWRLYAQFYLKISPVSTTFISNTSLNMKKPSFKRFSNIVPSLQSKILLICTWNSNAKRPCFSKISCSQTTIISPSIPNSWIIWILKPLIRTIFIMTKVAKNPKAPIILKWKIKKIAIWDLLKKKKKHWTFHRNPSTKPLIRSSIPILLRKSINIKIPSSIILINNHIKTTLITLLTKHIA